jgi:hypothetical protein
MNEWTWVYLGEQGALKPADVTDGAATFSSQADAEAWVGEQWRTLLTQEVESVTLRRDGVDVYGPMSLRPAP